MILHPSLIFNFRFGDFKDQRSFLNTFVQSPLTVTKCVMVQLKQ